MNTPPIKRVFLIGFMGTGKSAVGRHLAEKLGWSFFDTDAMIEQDVGIHIHEIFAKKGEPFFRDTESAVLAMVASFDHCVISTGGGAVLRDENKKIMQRDSLVLYLKASPETILYRIGEDHLRPLLPKGSHAKENVKALLLERSPHYEACRTHEFDTDEYNEEALAEMIMTSIKDLVLKP